MTKDEFMARVLAMQDRLYRVSYSMLPNPHDQDDAVQECARIALQKMGTLRDARYLETWLVRILINECNSILRKHKREGPTEEMEIVLPPDGDREVIEALMTLEVRLRLPIVLNYIEGYTVKEIAGMLRVPESTVKTRMARARKLLRETLAEGGLENA